MSTCLRCGSTFECGMTDAAGTEPCWCTRLPSLSPSAYAKGTDSLSASCFCPSCLRALLAVEDASESDRG